MHLFIIGNGFDINHGYRTDYKSFKKYLYSHSYPILGIELSQYFQVKILIYGMTLKMNLSLLILKKLQTFS